MNSNIINHPVHIKDNDNHTMPSAFIPFCFFGSNLSQPILGKKIDMFTYPICTNFTPKIFLGQMCYQLHLEEIQEVMLEKGKENGLTLLLDYNEEKMMNRKAKNRNFEEALIYIDTLGKNFMIICIQEQYFWLKQI